jgi:hypothetical protein
MEIKLLSASVFKHLVAGTLASNSAVGLLELARPSKSNAFHAELWDEFPKVCIQQRTMQMGAQLLVIVFCFAFSYIARLAGT